MILKFHGHEIAVDECDLETFRAHLWQKAFAPVVFFAPPIVEFRNPTIGQSVEPDGDYAGEELAPEPDTPPTLESVALQFVQHPTLENFALLKRAARRNK